MKKFLVAFGVIMIYACSTPALEPEEIIYFQDARTHLCFAAWINSQSYNIASITCVPCDSVKAFLKK